MPGKMGPLLRKRAMRLSRISSLTRRLRTRCSENCELLRSSPRVCGNLLKGWIPPGSRPPSSHSGPDAAECWYSTPAMMRPARDGRQHSEDYRSRKEMPGGCEQEIWRLSSITCVMTPTTWLKPPHLCGGRSALALREEFSLENAL